MFAPSTQRTDKSHNPNKPCNNRQEKDANATMRTPLPSVFLHFILRFSFFYLILQRKTEIQNFYGRLSRGKHELVK
jgi:hypothetical protein